MNLNTMLSTLLVFCLCLFGLAEAQEVVTVEAQAVLDWEDIVRFDGMHPPSGYGPAPSHKPLPGPREIPPPSEITSDELQSLLSHAASDAPPVPADATGVSFSLITDFEALPDNNAAIPPDTHGAAGPNHLMVMLNTQVRIQTKTGTNISTVSLSNFWSSLGGSVFDPKILYDPIHGRWIAVCDANPASTTSRVYFAISSTNDPTGQWSFYSIDADPADTVWADYPGVGVNNTWVAITNNMFRVSPPQSFRGAKMWVIDKASALVPGGPITLTVFPQGFDNSGGVYGFTLQPCQTFGTESTLYIVDNSGWSSSGTFLVRLSRITGTGTSPSWSVVPGSLFSNSGLFFVTNNFNYAQVNANQLGTDSLIATNDPRMLNAVFRNSRIWCTHSGGLPVAPSASNRTAAFWYQLNPSAMPTPIVQSGVIDAGAGVHHYFPSITVNANDDACLGFTRSDVSRYAEGVFTGRRSADVVGTMRPLRLLKQGLARYLKKFSDPRIRWGDYSASVVDPSNDTTFWTIQEYAALNVGPLPNDTRWGTWWGMIQPSEITSVEELTFPTRTALFQNYPNPFNPTTEIRYQMSEVGHVTLKVYNVFGQEVAVLVDEIKQMGVHDVTFNASGLSSGAYFCQLQSGSFIDRKKLLVLK
jgi:hypothetical protein